MRTGFGKYKFKNINYIEFDYILEIPPFSFSSMEGYRKYSVLEHKYDPIIKDMVLYCVISTNSYHELRMRLNLLGVENIVYIERNVSIEDRDSGFYIYFRKSN